MGRTIRPAAHFTNAWQETKNIRKVDTHLSQTPRSGGSKPSHLQPLIGISPDILQIRELIRHTAGLGFHTVISGESGVGKEVVAKRLHAHSPRRGKPFVKVNCAALPDTLLDAELFGFEKGAFTGARVRKRGKFELAGDGVLFLDEIGEMSPALQARLLHVLESGTFSPLGAETEIHVNTWVIAATNSRLEEKVRSGQFREDLYYRLNIIRIPISALRKRPEDIAPLFNYYFRRFTVGTALAETLKPAPCLLKKLAYHAWPGNVRELRNVIQRAVALKSWHHVFEELPHLGHSWHRYRPPGLPAEIAPIVENILSEYRPLSTQLSEQSLKEMRDDLLSKIEKEVLRHVLLKTGWNRRRASKILDIAYYTLNRKIADHTLLPPPYLR